jgi:DTW domain-containing protein YfiP
MRKQQQRRSRREVEAHRRMLRAVEQMAAVTPLDAHFIDALNEYRDAREEHDACQREVEQ